VPDSDVLDPPAAGRRKRGLVVSGSACHHFNSSPRGGRTPLCPTSVLAVEILDHLVLADKAEFFAQLSRSATPRYAATVSKLACSASRAGPIAPATK
jgi:hypothetical protein